MNIGVLNKKLNLQVSSLFEEKLTLKFDLRRPCLHSLFCVLTYAGRDMTCKTVVT